MLTPKYTITGRLLENIKRVNILISELNHRHFPKVVLFELERAAREVSAHASTSIEGNPLPLTEVKKLLKSKTINIRESEKEVLNYNRALEYLEIRLQEGKTDISLSLVLGIHKIVMKGLLDNRAYEGALRKNPVVVNDPRSGQVVYLPPNASEVKSLIVDLVDFVNQKKSEIDPLILSGIFHKQMVLIHPFIDGNGRATRLATKVLMAQMGLNTFNLFSFENYYNKNVTRYFQHVGERGDYYELRESIDFTNWLEYFTEGIIDELLRVQGILPKTSQIPEIPLEKHHQKILEYIKEHRFIKDNEYAKIVTRSRASRILDFQKLIILGLIERKGKGKSTYYILKENH